LIPLFDCVLFSSVDSNWWAEEALHDGINDVEREVSILNLKNGDYYWKVECTDVKGYKSVSESRIYSINSALVSSLGINLIDETERIDGIISQIDVALDHFNTMTGIEREAYESLSFQKKMERYKTDLKRANRDLYNLQFLKFNTTEEEQEYVDKINNKIDQISGDIPTDLKVEQSNEYVSYSSSEKVEEVLYEYIDVKKLVYSDKEIQTLLKNSEELQDKLLVTTQFKIVRITYSSREEKIITLITKDALLENNLTEVVYLEYIPKKFADNYNKLVFLSEHEAIRSDPIIKLNETNAPEIKFSYYLKGTASLNDAQETQLIALTTDTTGRVGNAITGFSIFGGVNNFISDTIEVRLAFEIVVIIILVFIFLAFTQGIFDGIFAMVSKDKKMTRSIKKKIKKAVEHLDNKEREKSKEIYQDLSKAFAELPKKSRKVVYKDIVDLAHRIDAAYIHSKLSQAFVHIDNNKKGEAMSLYADINKLYKKISPKYKSKVLIKCKKLHKKLTE